MDKKSVRQIFENGPISKDSLPESYSVCCCTGLHLMKTETCKIKTDIVGNCARNAVKTLVPMSQPTDTIKTKKKTKAFV